MSSKASKLKDQIMTAQEQGKATKSINYRVDVNIAGIGIKSTYIVVTGIPEDLPDEYEDTIKRSAEAQFATAINQRLFLEFYNKGKTSRDEQPTFYNLSKLDWIGIDTIEKVSNI